VGKPGAVNAGLFAASLLSQSDVATRRAWKKYRLALTAKVLKARLPSGD
jgi:phosphoribosylcarboxyaminoimidazole (NCAIR) mutase